MLARLLRAAGVAAIAAPAAIAASCGGKVIVDGVSEHGTGGAGGGGGSAAQGTGGASCTLSSTATGNPSDTMQVTECVMLTGDACLPKEEAATQIMPSTACNEIVSAECGPVHDSKANTCCYLMNEKVVCVPGRPFLVGAEAKTAAVEHVDRGWATGGLVLDADGVAPAMIAEAEPASLAAGTREALAAAWEADALLEHASIAAFSRFALELLAVGAPPDLIAAAHQAATDEVRHARLCFGMAQRYGGEPIAPTPFPFGGSVTVSGNLAELAASTAREGCIGESLAAAIAGDQLARAEDPAVRRVLAAITEDETRHAELAWRTVAWAIERGGEEVRSAVEAVFLESSRALPDPAVVPDVPERLLAAHGRLDADSARVAMMRALDEVIRPCAHALLERAAVSMPPAMSRRA